MSMESDISQTTFSSDFFARLLGWCYAYQGRYWDDRRFGPMPELSLLERAKRRLKAWGASRGWAARHFHLPVAGAELARIMAAQSDYARGYALLADAYSRNVYLDLLAFRALGPLHVRLPANIPAYWREWSRDDIHIVKRNTATASMGSVHWTLNQYDVPGKTEMLHLHMPPGSYQYYFIQRSYDYDREGCSIGVESGDVVINGGGCWGDTDIMFADRCAPDGRVFTFEFVPENLEIMRLNLAANPALARRIEPVKNALGEVSGQTMEFSSHGPGTQVAAVGSQGVRQRVMSLTVDDLVAQRGLARVDFIKMDIEGAELRALQGAENTLRRFRPKLAISAYHKPEDLYTLSTFLDRLQLGYRFYMDHFTVHLEETVLFAACDKRRTQAPPFMR